MTNFSTIIRAYVAPVLLATAGSLVAACSGGHTGSLPPANAFPSSAAAHSPAAAPVFSTIDNQKDITFNQLLGTNNFGKIAGYYGSGAAGHPNKGYTIHPPYAQNSYANENYPGSAQTQVTGINDKGYTSGFWVDKKGTNYGFIEWNGVFTSYTDPKTGKGTVNQILGINNAGEAVGFYVNAQGTAFGFRVSQATGKFAPVTPPGGTNVTAAGINATGDITGFYTAGKKVVGFLRKGTQYLTLSYPNSTSTTPFGINTNDQIVGAYTDKAKKMHGFLLSNPTSHAKWQSFDDPNGVGATVINGLNDKGVLVGFYTDKAGNTHGMRIKI